jgi:MOSC domain-containing protein YiiM
MKLVSLNVAAPHTVVWKGHEVRTGIFKEPVEGPVMMRRLNLDGDRQADLTVHGGSAKAVYAYPSEHYPLWKNELTEIVLPWGMFGKISRPKEWSSTRFTLATNFESAKQS